MEKYINFLIPIEKEVIKIDKNGDEITKTIFYRLQFIDSAKFIASSLSNLVNNLSQGIHEITCTNCNKCCFEYKIFRHGLIEFIRFYRNLIGFIESYDEDTDEGYIHQADV